MSVIAISGKIKSGKDELAMRLQYNRYLDKTSKAIGLGWDKYEWEEFKKETKEKRHRLSGIEQVSFAARLKKVAAAIMGINLDDFHDERELKENYYVNLLTFRLTHKDNLRDIHPDGYITVATPEAIGGIVVHGENMADNIYASYRVFMLQYLGTEVCRKAMPHIWANTTFNTYDKRYNWVLSDTRFTNEARICKKVEPDTFIVRVVRPETDVVAPKTSSETDLDNYEFFDMTLINDGTYDEFLEKCDALYKELAEKFGW